MKFIKKDMMQFAFIIWCIVIALDTRFIRTMIFTSELVDNIHLILSNISSVLLLLLSLALIALSDRNDYLMKVGASFVALHYILYIIPYDLGLPMFIYFVIQLLGPCLILFSNLLLNSKVKLWYATYIIISIIGSILLFNAPRSAFDIAIDLQTAVLLTFAFIMSYKPNKLCMSDNQQTQLSYMKSNNPHATIWLDVFFVLNILSIIQNIFPVQIFGAHEFVNTSTYNPESYNSIIQEPIYYYFAAFCNLIFLGGLLFLRKGKIDGYWILLICAILKAIVIFRYSINPIYYLTVLWILILRVILNLKINGISAWKNLR